MITETTNKVSKQPKFQGPDELPMLPEYLIEMDRTEADKYHILMREWWESVHENLERLRSEVVSFKVNELEETTASNTTKVANDLSDHITDKDNPHEVTPEQLGLHAVATSGEYSDLENKPNLHAVATSGNYSDLTGTPNLHAVATSGDYDDLINSPDFVYDSTTRTLSIST